MGLNDGGNKAHKREKGEVSRAQARTLTPPMFLYGIVTCLTYGRTTPTSEPVLRFVACSSNC